MYLKISITTYVPLTQAQGIRYAKRQCVNMTELSVRLLMAFGSQMQSNAPMNSHSFIQVQVGYYYPWTWNSPHTMLWYSNIQVQVGYNVCQAACMWTQLSSQWDFLWNLGLKWKVKQYNLPQCTPWYSVIQVGVGYYTKQQCVDTTELTVRFLIAFGSQMQSSASFPTALTDTSQDPISLLTYVASLKSSSVTVDIFGFFVKEIIWIPVHILSSGADIKFWILHLHILGDTC